MRTLRCLKVCDDDVSRQEGLSGVDVGPMDCAVFVGPRERQSFWGYGTLCDLYLNCVDDSGLVVESVLIPQGHRQQIVSDGAYSVAFESRYPFLGRQVEFEPGLVRVV